MVLHYCREKFCYIYYEKVEHEVIMKTDYLKL